MTEPTSVQEVEKIEQQSVSFEEQMARLFMALTEEELQAIKQSNPQRSMPQIILVMAIKIGNLEIVEWVGDNHLPVLSQIISPDTWSILNDIGFPIPS